MEAEQRLAQLRTALAQVIDVGECAFDHIGSTAVPGLDAKAYIDLQVRMPVIPQPGVLDPVVTAVGWVAAHGSRVDSPGVTRDIPNPGDAAPDWVWAKRLFVSDDAKRPAILHVRLMASPFGRRTVAFRDRLRAEPELAAVYQRLKHRLAAEHASDPDYDDYTRGKTTFIRAASD